MCMHKMKYRPVVLNFLSLRLLQRILSLEHFFQYHHKTIQSLGARTKKGNNKYKGLRRGLRVTIVKEISFAVKKINQLQFRHAISYISQNSQQESARHQPQKSFQTFSINLRKI